MKKECVAMLLAGGQGSRLYVLTEELAKPAVPFGGKYRIIDFPLSNCINSGIDTVGVLTQYQPHALNAYIGSGQPWDLDRLNGGVFILPPYMRGKSGEWYKGTANAIYQNIGFIRQYDPEYVIVLGGDHIYKMDYSLMLRSHRKNNADATIAVIEVPIEEASRFGIMETDDTGRVTKFAEKPKEPQSNLASMGIYIFNWKLLEQYLIADEQNPKSSNDFGKNIIPMMLEDKKRLFVYRFEGYWKDVGTIDSLWEANMDLLSPSSGLNLHESDMKIYARNVGSPPGFIAGSAKVSHSLITEGSDIYGEVDSSVIFTNVTVEKNAKVQYSIIMPGAVIEEGAQVKYAIISEDCRIGKNAKVGGVPAESKPDAWGIAVVGPGRSVGERCVVLPQQVVAEDIVMAKTKKRTEKKDGAEAPKKRSRTARV